MIKLLLTILMLTAVFGAVLFVWSLNNKLPTNISLSNAPRTERLTGESSLPKLQKPHLLIKKKQRQLELFDNEKLIKTYQMALGFEPTGNKIKRGDGRTPEGEFYIDRKNPKSQFYLSLGVSYPNVKDAERGLRDKVITQKQHDAIVRAIKMKQSPPQNTALGGDIFIHGGGISQDWTWGCVALENDNIKELFEILPVGTPVVIEP